MGKSQRDKGKRGEREVVAAFRRYGFDAKRGAPMQWGDATAAPDVVVDGFWVEVKLGKKPNPVAAYRQAVEDSGGKETPLACTRQDRGEWMVTLSLEHFLALLRTSFP